MKHRRIHIRKWSCDFWFVTEETYDEALFMQLLDCGANEEIISKAMELFDKNNYNSGLIFSNPECYRSIIIIGKATSNEEFLNTFIHELVHLTYVISLHYNLDMSGESIAYLIGDAISELSDIVCEYTCDKCRSL